MLKRLIIFMIIISLSCILQNCATMIGYSIGKKLDNKAEHPTRMIIPKTESDSTMVDSTNVIASNAPIEKKEKTYYAVIGVTLGITLDLVIIFIILLQANPIRPNIRF